MRGIEPRAFHMQSERSTTELHPQTTVEPNLSNLKASLIINNISKEQIDSL